MREIKFRGKRFYNNKWVYGNLFIDKDGERYILENDYLEQDGHHLVCNSDTPVFMMEETIGQYTGLHDKNGKEIFEGDIVKIYDDYNAYGILAGEIYEVYFAFGGFRLKPKHNPKARGHWMEDGVDFEVTGNIYDNPDLLEGDKS